MGQTGATSWTSARAGRMHRSGTTTRPAEPRSGLASGGPRTRSWLRTGHRHMSSYSSPSSRLDQSLRAATGTWRTPWQGRRDTFLIGASIWLPAAQSGLNWRAMMRWHDRYQAQTPAQMKVDCYDDHAAPPLVYPPADRPVPAPQLGSDGPWGGRFPLRRFPATPPAGRPGAGQASSPCREGAGGGLTRQPDRSVHDQRPVLPPGRCSYVRLSLPCSSRARSTWPGPSPNWKTSSAS